MSNELVVRDGRTLRQVPSGFTIREWYSHSTPEKGPGPGWDTRFPTLQKYGVDRPENLPDDPHFFLEEVFS